MDIQERIEKNFQDRGNVISVNFEGNDIGGRSYMDRGPDRVTILLCGISIGVGIATIAIGVIRIALLLR